MAFKKNRLDRPGLSPHPPDRHPARVGRQASVAPHGTDHFPVLKRSADSGQGVDQVSFQQVDGLAGNVFFPQLGGQPRDALFKHFQLHHAGFKDKAIDYKILWALKTNPNRHGASFAYPAEAGDAPRGRAGVGPRGRSARGRKPERQNPGKRPTAGDRPRAFGFRSRQGTGLY